MHFPDLLPKRLPHKTAAALHTAFIKKFIRKFIKNAIYSVPVLCGSLFIHPYQSAFMTDNKKAANSGISLSIRRTCPSFLMKQ